MDKNNESGNFLELNKDPVLVPISKILVVTAAKVGNNLIINLVRPHCFLSCLFF